MGKRPGYFTSQFSYFPFKRYVSLFTIAMNILHESVYKKTSRKSMGNTGKTFISPIKKRDYRKQFH